MLVRCFAEDHNIITIYIDELPFKHENDVVDGALERAKGVAKFKKTLRLSSVKL